MRKFSVIVIALASLAFCQVSEYNKSLQDYYNDYYNHAKNYDKWKWEELESLNTDSLKKIYTHKTFEDFLDEFEAVNIPFKIKNYDELCSYKEKWDFTAPPDLNPSNVHYIRKFLEIANYYYSRDNIEPCYYSKCSFKRNNYTSLIFLTYSPGANTANITMELATFTHSGKLIDHELIAKLHNGCSMMSATKQEPLIEILDNQIKVVITTTKTIVGEDNEQNITETTESYLVKVTDEGKIDSNKSDYKIN